MLHRVENTNSPQPELHPRDVCDVVDLAINVHLWLKSGVIDGERADIVLQKVVACLAEWRSVHRSSPLNHLSDAVQSSVDDLKSCILGDEADLASTNLQRLDLCSYAFFYQPNALPLAQIEFVLSSSLNTDSTADRQGLIDRLRGLTIEQILDGLGSYFFTHLWRSFRAAGVELDNHSQPQLIATKSDLAIKLPCFPPSVDELIQQRDELQRRLLQIANDMRRANNESLAFVAQAIERVTPHCLDHYFCSLYESVQDTVRHEKSPYPLLAAVAILPLSRPELLEIWARVQTS